MKKKARKKGEDVSKRYIKVFFCMHILSLWYCTVYTLRSCIKTKFMVHACYCTCMPRKRSFNRLVVFHRFWWNTCATNQVIDRREHPCKFCSCKDASLHLKDMKKKKFPMKRKKETERKKERNKKKERKEKEIRLIFHIFWIRMKIILTRGNEEARATFSSSFRAD